MSQASISSFFKRKPVGTLENESPPKQARIERAPVRAKTPPPVPLSERTKHWHISDKSPLPPRSPAKVKAHEKFVEKLGDYVQKKQQWRTGEAGSEADDGNPGAAQKVPGEEEEEDEVSDDNPRVTDLAERFQLGGTSTKSKKSVRAKDQGPKLTPLETQIQTIQAENPSTMLLVEVGYKYRFFGDDARTASQILGIAYFKSHSFLTASVPVHRLQHHVNRLVAAGKKVGVVRQAETAALKAVGENKNKTFERKLCEVYSKGTYLGDNAADVVGGWILAVTVKQVSGQAAVNESTSASQASENSTSSAAQPRGGKVTIGVVAIRAETGEVVHDEFQDGPLRSELEKRLLLLDVVEVIQVGPIDSVSRKIVLSSDRRLEEMTILTDVDARERVKSFYTSIHASADTEPVLTKILQLPTSVLQCLAAQMKYLAEFKLESIFTLTNFFSTFEDKMCMQLPATTLAALEIFQNTTDGSEHGSLFWLLNNTKTLPGRRMLRKWIARPLVNMRDLASRQNAVQEVVNARGASFSQLDKVRTMLRKLPDLEKGLSKIFYGKCSRPEVLQVLHAFQRVSRTFDRKDSFAFESPALRDGFSSLSTISEIVDGFLAEFNHVEAAKDDKYSKSIRALAVLIADL